MHGMEFNDLESGMGVQYERRTLKQLNTVHLTLGMDPLDEMNEVFAIKMYLYMVM